MNLNEQTYRIKQMMGLVTEDNQDNVFYFGSKSISVDYTTFKNISNFSNIKDGDKITLVNKNDPSERYEFTLGVDLSKSKFRDNEAYFRNKKTKTCDKFSKSHYTIHSRKWSMADYLPWLCHP